MVLVLLNTLSFRGLNFILLILLYLGSFLGHILISRPSHSPLPLPLIMSDNVSICYKCRIPDDANTNLLGVTLQR